jgi:protein gp37
VSENSKIEWTDHTFNPWEGCQKVGPGCDHCYAETRNARFGGGTAVNWGPGAPRRRTSPANWRKPLAWNARHDEFFAAHGRRQRVFCASLADVFDNEVPTHWRQELMSLIARTPNLDWLLLTKRIGNAARMLEEASQHDGFLMGADDHYRALPNVWIGATIVNRQEMLRDAGKLLAVPARVRFWSVEPMLGDLEEIPVNLMPDWVICGGESGRGARPMNQSWARSLRNQCEDAGVPFLFKQWGEWAPGNAGPGGDLSARDRTKCASGFFTYNDDWIDSGPNPFRQTMDRIGKKVAGRELDGRTHDEFPKGA